MCMKEKLIPGGILEPVSGKSFLFFGNSYKTSDFMADDLLVWWQHRRPELGGNTADRHQFEQRAGMQRPA